MFNCYLIISFIALSLVAVVPAHSKPQKSAPRQVVVVVPERTQVATVLRSQINKVMTPLEWQKMAAGMEEVKSLKVGVTRADVLKSFQPLNNEIYSQNQRRYWLDDYPDLIVALDFKTSFLTSSDPHIFLNPQAYRMADYSGYFTDVLTKIKVYYVGPATEKKHTVVLQQKRVLAI